MSYFGTPRKTKSDMIHKLNQAGVFPATAIQPCNNTLDYTLECGTRRIRLHDTDILEFTSNGGFRIQTNGFNTVTTRDRLNIFLPAGFGVYTLKGQLHLSKYLGGGNHGFATAFDCMIKVGPRGGIQSDTSDSKVDTLRKQINRFMRGYKLDGLPPVQDSRGDPWILGVVSSDVMRDWLKTDYRTRTLVMLALQLVYPDRPEIVRFHLSDMDLRGGEIDSLTYSRIRRYIRRTIGLAS